MYSPTNIQSVLSSFEPISLQEMDSVKLMTRIDTKYVLPLSSLENILTAAQSDYLVQEIETKRITTYTTTYYDTADLHMYMRHHDRQLTRQKIRVRQYVDSDLSFLEIKRKNNKGRTNKKRIRIPDLNITGQTIGYSKNDQTTVANFIEQKSHYSFDLIQPKLNTDFQRITLVNKAKTERLTIDFNLVWKNLSSSTQYTYPNLVIVELKRDGNTISPMVKIMLQQRIKPLKISKYCIGMAITTPNIKRNRFKNKIRKIEKILSI